MDRFNHRRQFMDCFLETIERDSHSNKQPTQSAYVPPVRKETGSKTPLIPMRELAAIDLAGVFTVVKADADAARERTARENFIVARNSVERLKD